MEKKVFNLLKLLFFIKFFDTKRCDFKYDNIFLITNKNLELINEILKDFLIIKFENNKYFFQILDKKILDTKVYKILDILNLDRNEVFWYIENNFDFKTIIYLKYYFWIIFEEIRDNNIFLKYIKSQNDAILKEILYVFYYWFFNVNKKNMLISIWLLENLISKFPKISTFHLLKIRQRFECFYRYWISKNVFNELILTKNWLAQLYDYKQIVTLFDEVKIIQNSFNDPISDLFIWKIYLHFLDERWVDFLNNYLLKTSLNFDEDVFSWFWVYYMQIWDYNKAKKYFEWLNFINYEPYKIISKKVLLNILENNFWDFFKEINKYEIIFYLWKKFFIYKNNLLTEINFEDKFDNKTKLWFCIENFNKNEDFNNTENFYKYVFKSIPKQFSKHFVIGDFDKMIINYK